MKDPQDELEQLASDYWRECVSQALDEAQVIVRQDQIEDIALFIEGAHEMHAETTGDLRIPNPDTETIRDLERKLNAERGKVACPECCGAGSVYIAIGTSHISSSVCQKCRGEGKIAS